MAKFKLQALAPRRVCVGLNADGTQRFAEFTDAHSRHYVEQGNKMLAKGLHVPCIWEHRDDGKPRKLSIDDWNTERTRGVNGFAESFEADAQGRAWVNVEIPDPADCKQAEKVRFCSPEIKQFTDGDGTDWGEVFTHIALTPRPVQHDQPAIARLSFLAPIRLSVDSETGEDMEKGEEKPAEKPPEKKPDEKKPEDSGAVKALIEALRSVGMNIPDQVVSLGDLTIAVLAGGAKGGDFDDDDDMQVSPVASGAGGGGGMALSLENQIKQAEKLARTSAGANLDALLKRRQITHALHVDLKKRLAAVRLSFNDTGELVSNDVLAEIAAYGKLPRGHVRTDSPGKVRLSGVQEVEALPTEKPDESPEAQKKRMDAYEKTLA